ncbi:MAG: flagellar hook-length control protein FliK, partial [Campylobacterota bacterium]|nr:flagellar hook-length control protein FliK [Campylobacterota bacterium]
PQDKVVKIKEDNIQTIKSTVANKIEQSILNNPILATSTTPPPLSDVTKRLEALLNSKKEESKDKTSLLKAETTTVHKADNFEIKLNEAKQMMKYLSSDLKTAIDNYKSPFTRVKVQLNPQRLGEVDLTVVQRGKNLHVNISSNNTAVNTLAMNINELRVQLNSSGINNATINFNNSAQNSESDTARGQNPQQQEQQNAKKEYNYFDNEEQNEEIISSLEIIVPNYA